MDAGPQAIANGIITLFHATSCPRDRGPSKPQAFDRRIDHLPNRIIRSSRAAQGGCSRSTWLYSATMAGPRYAIYYVPAPGSELDGFGAKLLGYDAHSGEDLRFPDGILRMAPDWYDLTKDPRKYGFHATLKAPFSLAPGKAEAELLAACKAFASTTLIAGSGSSATGDFVARISWIKSPSHAEFRGLRRGLMSLIRESIKAMGRELNDLALDGLSRPARAESLADVL